MNRRQSIALLASSLAGQSRVPIRRITRPPGYHWFGYYDKLQFDPSGRFVLGMRVDFEHRSPQPEDEVEIGVIDTVDGDGWKSLGSSKAWNWQQGAMLQWVPRSDSKVLWNDRVGNQFVCRIHDLKKEKTETIPAPIYTLHPDGRTAISPDFRRLNDCRPGYGYAGIPDPNRDNPAPSEAGIWSVDLKNGKQQLLISFDQAFQVAPRQPYSKGAKHWFNHLLFNTDGTRFIFLHRWRGEAEGKGFSTRMFTANRTGKDLYVLDPFGRTSHFIWRDAQHVLAWAWHPLLKQDRFYLYTDKTESVEAVGADVMTVNGHCSYLPGNRWILNDTYPDKDRIQHLYLYEAATGRKVPLADLASPPAYNGEWRTDLHPRFSPDGSKICVDSTHEGKGRQMYLIDIEGMT